MATAGRRHRRTCTSDLRRLVHQDEIVHYAKSPLGLKPASATMPISQVGKLGIPGGGAVRALKQAGDSLPLLTSRRHIDLGRVSSAICRPF
ncbi:putative leader peptide [Streptomyces roseolilacinus]|uniref:putative leader peptide n=1 Tax=Streptomyces roseolilacinus TaxID=66904 RepID=UPI003570CEED